MTGASSGIGASFCEAFAAVERMLTRALSCDSCLATPALSSDEEGAPCAAPPATDADIGGALWSPRGTLASAGFGVAPNWRRTVDSSCLKSIAGGAVREREGLPARPSAGILSRCERGGRDGCGRVLA